MQKLIIWSRVQEHKSSQRYQKQLFRVMKKYCFDTSGISNPLEMMPEDIYDSMWAKVTGVIITGCIAVTKEIYDEMKHIPGQIGVCIKSNEAQMLLEVGKKGWNWEPYVKCAEEMQISHEPSSRNTTEALKGRFA